MKRLTDIFLLLCLVLAAVSCKDSGEERSHVLKVYNWADYIDEDVLAEFPAWYKQQTGEDIRLIYQVFDINEIMLTKIERGHEDFDVVCPSEYIIERMLKKDLLLPIDRNFGKTPDYLPNISPYIRRELNKTSQPERTTTDYAVPYMWGTAGILYNRNFITPDEAGSWHCLWNPRNKGKILMKDSYRDAYGTAIIYAHARQLADSTVTVEQLMNDNSPEAIALAEKYLKAMKPNIAGWEADFGKEMMTKNKTWLNLTWSGDAVWAIEVPERSLCIHLDTYLSRVDYDTFVVDPQLLAESRSYQITRNRAENLCQIHAVEKGVKEALAAALGIPELRFIPCGGSNPNLAEKECTNNAASVLCLRPGKVCVYEENQATNAALEQAGIDLVPISIHELTNGFGGPNCLCLPLRRDE